MTHDPLPVVMADEMQLSQLFQNLIGQCHQVPEAGIPKIHVSAVMNGQKKWNFSVRDNGIGIESKNFERIFGMFQRLHKRSEFEGTGIGLAICKKIVERHGGTSWSSCNPGKEQPLTLLWPRACQAREVRRIERQSISIEAIPF